MREGGGSTRLVSAEPEREENDEERDGDEEGRDGGITEREEDEDVTQGQRNVEIGEEDVAADGGLSTTATLGGGAQNPATLLEKRGITRCVGTPD
ncbi:hypothetical protein NDU88_001887 [Pleurodeles waltl]|uniref:Uncharacterized protein n=1 Tax=Pleurodeles waltl TaxID=8319 RepID=A0AAV7TK22_PLEWA|nr:hypothetical protein NDU88_001887 [Pleurodeles waltl]